MTKEEVEALRDGHAGVHGRHCAPRIHAVRVTQPTLCNSLHPPFARPGAWSRKTLASAAHGFGARLDSPVRAA
jgi:hypothetical protein